MVKIYYDPFLKVYNLQQTTSNDKRTLKRWNKNITQFIMYTHVCVCLCVNIYISEIYFICVYMCFCIGILLPRKRKSYIIHHRLHSLRPLARRSYFYLIYQFLPAYSTKFQEVTFIITGTNVSKWYKTAVYISVKFKYFR